MAARWQPPPMVREFGCFKRFLWLRRAQKLIIYIAHTACVVVGVGRGTIMTLTTHTHTRRTGNAQIGLATVAWASGNRLISVIEVKCLRGNCWNRVLLRERKLLRQKHGPSYLEVMLLSINIQQLHLSNILDP